jgi:hypothetical protein
VGTTRRARDNQNKIAFFMGSSCQKGVLVSRAAKTAPFRHLFPLMVNITTGTEAVQIKSSSTSPLLTFVAVYLIVWRVEHPLTGGVRLRVNPRCRHIFYGIGDTSVVEYGPQVYDETDTYRVDGDG